MKLHLQAHFEGIQHLSQADLPGEKVSNLRCYEREGPVLALYQTNLSQVINRT